MEKAAKIFTFLLGLVCLIETSLLTQDLPIRNYSEKDGLAGGYVVSICQDSKGFLWFGTDNGLTRFDGFSFKNFQIEDGLPDTVIPALFEDREGRLWYGTSKGGTGYYLKGKFHNYSLRHGLPDKEVLTIAEDRSGHIWFGTMKGLARFDGKRFRTYTSEDGLPSDTVIHLAADTEGKLWVGTQAGLCYISGESIHVFQGINSLSRRKVYAIFRDSSGTLWIGTNNGLYYYSTRTSGSYTVEDGLGHNHINRICEDKRGNLIIGTWNGISIFNGKTFASFTSENGLPDNFINTLLRDREGNTWIATFSGVSCLTSSRMVTFTKKDGLVNNTVDCIIQDRRGGLWIGTRSGLSLYSGGKFRNFTKRQGLAGTVINHLLEDRDGNIWVATPEGVSVFSPIENRFIKHYTEKDGLSDYVCLSLAQGRDGTVLIGNRKGINRFKNGRFSKFLPGSKSHPVIDILEDNHGNIWAASQSGLYKYSGDKVECYTTDDGLPSNRIRTLFQDSRGNIHITTDRGTACSGKGKFDNCTTREGLPDNKCYFITEDRQGYLWVGTAKGLARFDGKKYRTFTAKNHGLPGDLWACGLVDRDGALWVGGSQGLARLTPPMRINRVPPPVYFTGIKIFEDSVSPEEMRSLPYNRNYLRFSYAGLCFSAPASVAYQYRLKGLGTAWSETNERSIFYPYLPSGDYVFEVKAINNDGFESEKPAQIPFTIQPPFWRTWWFRTLVILLVLALSGALMMRKYQRVEAQLALKARTRQLIMSQRMELMGMLAASAVHDLKNLLSIIIGFSEIAAEKYQPGDENYEHNEHIKSTANTAVQVVKQILSFSRVQYDEGKAVELGFLLDNLLEILKVTTPEEIEIRWQHPVREFQFNINPTRFQQLVMNLCINAVQAMSGGGVLTITLEQLDDKEQTIVITVSDTGGGIPEDIAGQIFEPLFTTKEQGKGTGLGLFVVKQIVEEFKGRIEVDSRPGQGTTFRITFFPGLNSPGRIRKQVKAD